MNWVVLFILKCLSWTYYLVPEMVKRIWIKSFAILLKASGFRKKVILENLSRAFPNDKESLKPRVRKAYEHLARIVFEVMMLFGPMPRFVRGRSRLLGLETIQAALKDGKGAILLASHVGNWEVMAASGTLLGNLDLLMVTKQLKPKWFHEAIENGRQRCAGLKGTYEPRTLKDVLGHLKKNGCVGIILDQYAGAPVSVRVPVFGTPVGTNTVVAMLAKRTGAPVIPVLNWIDSSGNYHVKIMPSLSWISKDDPNEEIAFNTENYSRVIEQGIFQYPEQWLWTHRRFKGDLSPLRPDEWKQPRNRT